MRCPINTSDVNVEIALHVYPIGISLPVEVVRRLPLPPLLVGINQDYVPVPAHLSSPIRLCLTPTATLLPFPVHHALRSPDLVCPQYIAKFGADGRTRTDDLRLTKGLLFHLSYIGHRTCHHHSLPPLLNRPRCQLRPRPRPRRLHRPLPIRHPRRTLVLVPTPTSYQLHAQRY